MERREGGFTVAIFSNPFYMSKLKRGEKPGQKRWEYKKRLKNGRKNGRKKGYCERPYYYYWWEGDR